VVAFVIPADENHPPAAAEVIQRVKNCLANYKVPKQVIVVEALPRNTMGKVLKNELRASLVNSSQDDSLTLAYPPYLVGAKRQRWSEHESTAR
jgi:acyl-coenzyme A synthetase/AMP-(fatty) acid ligase